VFGYISVLFEFQTFFFLEKSEARMAGVIKMFLFGSGEVN